MEKRYQIFISSTFVDLQEERQAVLRAVLELDHMPAGMELFPAVDDSAWQLIRDVIDGSDYYVLIVGGRYGSLDESGIGYTEREYDYASANKKPVIAFLHKNPDNLPREKTETDSAVWEKLKQFRAKIEKKHTCVYWHSAEDLKAKVIVGLTTAAKRHPAIGWVRADKVPTEATLADVLTLRNRIAQLEQEAAVLRDGPPAGTEGLAQGDDNVVFHFTFLARVKSSTYPYEQEYFRGSISQTWDAVFAAVAPSMIAESSAKALQKALIEALREEAYKFYYKMDRFKEHILRDFDFDEKEIETCIVQFRALGLIKDSDRKRSVKDLGTYWTLTPYGNTLMVQLRAVRRLRLPEDNVVTNPPEAEQAQS